MKVMLNCNTVRRDFLLSTAELFTQTLRQPIEVVTHNNMDYLAAAAEYPSLEAGGSAMLDTLQREMRGWIGGGHYHECVSLGDGGPVLTVKEYARHLEVRGPVHIPSTEGNRGCVTGAGRS